MSQVDTLTSESLIKEKLTLLIERETRYQLDQIITRMQQLAIDHDIGREGDRRSPLRNLLVAATDRTASLEIIKNYISYQTARSEDIGKVLKASYKGKKYGNALIEALDELATDANEILKRIEGSSEVISEADKAALQETVINQYLASPFVRSRELTDLHLKLVQLYLGYLVREHTAMRAAAKN